MQAIVVDPQASQRLALRTVEPPTPQATEALVRVRAISLNRGKWSTEYKGKKDHVWGGIWRALWNRQPPMDQDQPKEQES